MSQRIVEVLRQHPDLSSTEIATVLETDKRSGITSVLTQLIERGEILRIKRPNESNRLAYAYSLAPNRSSAPAQRPSRVNHNVAPRPVVDVPATVKLIEELPTSVDAIIARIPQMTIAEANRLRHALNEVFA